MFNIILYASRALVAVTALVRVCKQRPIPRRRHKRKTGNIVFILFPFSAVIKFIITYGG